MTKNDDLSRITSSIVLIDPFVYPIEFHFFFLLPISKNFQSHETRDEAKKRENLICPITKTIKSDYSLLNHPIHIEIFNLDFMVCLGTEIRDANGKRRAKIFISLKSVN